MQPVSVQSISMRQADPISRYRAWPHRLPWLIAALLLIMLLMINYWLWIHPQRGFNHIQQLQSEIDLQQQENVRLQRRNDAIKADIESLRDGLDAIEERARRDMGMIREGETLFRIIEQDTSGHAADSP